MATQLTQHDSAGTDHRESADDFRGEVCRAGAWRIIRCRDELQWIIQHRVGDLARPGVRWRSVGYCATKSALTRFWVGSAGEHARHMTDRLPDHIRRGT